MSKYILYCGQDGNFQTRCMLIPYDKYMESPRLQEDLAVLRKNAKPHTFVFNDEEYNVPQLLTQNIVFNGGCGHQEINEFTTIFNNLNFYADVMHQEVNNDGNREWRLLRDEDMSWAPFTIHPKSGGFNNVKNYCRLAQMTDHNGVSIEIIESFLILETRNGKYTHSQVDTVEEMFLKYYTNP